MPRPARFLGHNSLEQVLAIYDDGAGHVRKIFAAHRPDVNAIECRTGGYGMKLRRWWAHSRAGFSTGALIDTANWGPFWKQRSFNVRLFNSFPEYQANFEPDQLCFQFRTAEIVPSAVDRLAA
ncbi:MAG: hypothetical protein AABY95_01520 [Pseudomonadota bacterium]